MKRILKALLTASICLMSVIFLIACGCDVDGEKSPLAFELSSDESHYTVVGIGEFTGTSLVIPSTHEGLPVIAIGTEAFSGNETITEITIPESITSIGDNAFKNCTNVSVVNYNAKALSNTTSVYTRIFSSLGASTSGVTVNIGKDVESIPNLLFYQDEVANANNITAVYVADNSALTSISHGAFGNLPNLKEVSFGQNSKLATLGNGVFEYCRSLTSIKIPSTVTEIGSGAFNECTTLSVVEIESIDSWCRIKFENATSSPAYYSCALTLNGSVITNLIIPEGVSEIGDHTFSYNTAIKSVSIPSSVTKVGKFEDCVNLKEIIYNAKNATCTASPFQKAGNSTDKIKVVIGASAEVLPKEIFANNAHITTLDMSGATALTEIGEKAFWNSQNLEGVTSLPASVKVVSVNVFDGCNKILSSENGITYVGNWVVGRGSSIPSSLTFREGTVGIASGIFNGCAEIQSLTFPSSLVSIGVATFRDCTGLKEINLAETSSLSNVAGAGFLGCTEIATINIPSHKDWARINFGDKNANPLSQSSQAGLYCDGQKVTELVINGIDEIGAYAFKDYHALTKINLLVNKKIGANAFEGCTGITWVELKSNSDVIIEDNAFFNLKSLNTIAYNLKSVSLGDIENGIFYNAGQNVPDGISVHIGEDVESISSSIFKTKSSDSVPNISKAYFARNYNLKTVPSCFSGIKTLNRIVIPEGFTALDSDCLSGCTGLVSVQLPTTTTEIGARAFEYCSSLVQVNFPEGLVKIGSAAFANSSITSVDFPSTLQVIENSAFYKCSNLTTISAFPSSLTEIGDIVFYESALTGAITIPQSVTSLGYGVFVRTKITEAHIPNSLPLGSRMFEGCSELTAVTIPDNLTKIEGSTFRGCSKLTQIAIPSSVTVIGAEAFWGCSSLTSIVLPEGLTEVYSNAFKSCSKITELNLPSTLTTIGDGAFSLLKGVTKIVVPKSVKTIGEGAFSGCSSLKEITLPFIGKSAELTKEFEYTSTNETYFGYIFGNNGGDGVIVEQFVRGSLNNSSYKFVLPKNLVRVTVTSDHIPSYSFSGCTTIQVVTVECNEVSLAKNAFYSAKELALVEIKGKITEIPTSAFGFCESLLSVNITDNKITKIGNHAFDGCAKLLLVPFSDTLETIGDYAFSSCSSLDNIEIPASVNAIGSRAFEGCSALKSATFASSEGWSVKNNTEEFNIALNLPSRNATYLNDTYKDYAWARN